MSRPIDLYSEILALNLFAAAAVAGAAAVNGPDIVANAGLAEGGVVLVQTSGVTGGPTSFGLAVKLQTAPDNAGAPGVYVDLKDGFGNAEAITVSAAGVAKLRYEGSTALKYIRLVVTPIIQLILRFVAATALILAIVVQRWRIELLPGQRLELKPSVTLRQAGAGLHARLVARPQPSRNTTRENDALPATE